jgi:hypothetical protein
LAKAITFLPEDFILQLSRLEARTDEIVPKVLEAGGEVVLEHVRTRLRAVIGSGTKRPSRSTGELVDALGLTPARLNRNGDYDVKVGFNEPRRGKGDSNAKLASILEHGKHGQPPKPFLKPAKIASREACIERMRRVFDEEVGK